MTALHSHCVCRTLIGLGLGMWTVPALAQTPDIPIVATTSVSDPASGPAGPGQGPRLAPSSGPRITPEAPPPAPAAPVAPPAGPPVGPGGIAPELFASCAQLWSATPSPSCAAALEPARGVVRGCLSAHPAVGKSTWRLSFEIADGAPGDVAITPAEAADSALGRCLATSMQGLRFSTIDAAIPVAIDLPLDRHEGPKRVSHLRSNPFRFPPP